MQGERKETEMAQNKRRKEINLYSDDLLFRYRSATPNNLNAFADDTLYFSTPVYFNDPFDPFIFANYIEILSMVDHAQETGMELFLEKNKNKMSKEWYGVFSAIWNTPRLKDKLKEDIFQSVGVSSEKISKVLLKNTRIICLSEKFDSVLMWSHYTDSHKGFCIAYKKSVITEAEVYAADNNQIKKKPLLLPVSYVDKQVDLTEEVSEYVRAYKMPNLMGEYPPRTNLSQEKLRAVLTQKSLDWEYEKEWRVIPRHISLEHESNLHHMIAKPEALIIGMRCSEENKETLIGISKKKKLPVYQMVKNFMEPKFDLRPISIIL